ncbi:histone acetyltransferase HPA2 [Pseudomonas oryzihabitans]|uniref:DUF7931 domain-containing protein n=1 Tax=Pseudomonas oryzihabitans TaxID=47885 RepID=UPI002895E557|nr:histone acetyltransferase HPA2 [Pseudomonas oryzihabitans]MDT3718130.1 histone acetyltransferase HPA2 [Pseudomonas oryzihabitans]
MDESFADLTLDGLPEPRLGEDLALRLEGLDALREHSVRLISQARHQLCIQTPDLEAPLYDNVDVEAALKRLLLGNPRHQVRILINDSTLAMRQGHRLIALAQRLTSNLLIRRPLAEQRPEGACLIVDDLALLRRTGNAPNGFVRYGDRAAVRTQQQVFDRLWAISQAEMELRRMVL